METWAVLALIATIVLLDAVGFGLLARKYRRLRLVTEYMHFYKCPVETCGFKLGCTNDLYLQHTVELHNREHARR